MRSKAFFGVAVLAIALVIGVFASAGSVHAQLYGGTSASGSATANTGTGTNSSDTNGVMMHSSGTTNVNGTTNSSGTFNSSTSNTSNTTPGVPNTGAGGNALTNILLLGSSALVMAGGVSYLSRAPKASR